MCGILMRRCNEIIRSSFDPIPFTEIDHFASFIIAMEACSFHPRDFVWEQRFSLALSRIFRENYFILFLRNATAFSLISFKFSQKSLRHCATFSHTHVHRHAHAHAYAGEQDFRSSETPSATIVTALWLLLREFLYELLHNPVR